MNARKRSPHSMPKHTWRQTDRLLLSLLSLCFTSHVRNYTLIFNAINQQVLIQEGFLEGLPASSLNSQLYEMRNRGTGSQLYGALSALPLPQLKSNFAKQLRSIEDSAKQLGIDLTVRMLSEESRSLIPPRIHKRFKAKTMTTETSVTAWEPDLVDNDEEDVYTPTRSGKRKQINTPHLVAGSTGTDQPRYFLYRAFEEAMGLKARRFVNHDTIPHPPSPKSHDFQNEVRPHLTRNLRYDSPFMSLTQNPAIAMKHAFERSVAGVPMALAIFKYDDLVSDAQERYGAGSGPHLVPKVCEFFDMYDLPGEFTGVGEWVVWGSVRCPPVAIIGPAETLMLRAIFRVLKQTKAFDYAAGQRMGKFLPDVTIPIHKEIFLYDLLKGFKIPRHKAIRASDKWRNFVRGTTKTDDQIKDIQTTAAELQSDSDSNSDVMILEVRPCAASEQQQTCTMTSSTGFTKADWRSDTTSLMDWEFV